MELNIQSSGFQRIQLPAEEDCLRIRVDKRVHASLLLTYSGGKKPLISSLDIADEASLTLMMKHTGLEKANLEQKGILGKDSRLEVAFCELEDNSCQIDAVYMLPHTGGSVTVKSASIVSQKKEFKIRCVHESPYTTGLMEHYAVVKERGSYRMEACGKIEKGAHESASHQTTRVLTMSKEHDSEVLPVLLIDENDVKASHATTLGQPDENQLYYLQSRGLSRKQALGLLTLGYLLPISELFADEQLQEELKNEIETKVGLHV